MKTINSKAYKMLEDIPKGGVSSLQVSPVGVYTSPYIEKDIETLDKLEGLTMYTPEDIAFVNTSEFTKTGEYFTKHKVYTKLHPRFDRHEYDEFWDIEEERCLNGMTAPGRLIRDEYGNLALQQIHITGDHYGYLNYSPIKRTETKEEGNLILSLSGERLGKRNESIGKDKEVGFPAFWDGDYYYFKAVELARKIGKHLVVGKARRKGYSYKNAWLAAARANFIPKSVTVVGAYDEQSLTKDGTLNKVKSALDHINLHTDWYKGQLGTSLDDIHIGYKYQGESMIRGYDSHILKAVLSKDPGGFRGKDATLGILEEAGKCINLSEIIEPTVKSFSDGLYTTGLFIVFGTGGGDDKYWAGFEDLFYNVVANSFLAFENIWDTDMEGTECGFFHPSYMSKPGLIDIHGNSLIQETVAYEERERKIKAADPVKETKHKMEEPFSPSEAFSRATNEIMPSKEIELQLRRVERDPDLAGIGREGIFIEEDGVIIFYDRNLAGNLDKDLIPPALNDYPLRNVVRLDGCWTLWEQPYRDPKTGKIPDGLYRIWNDPFAISKEKEHFKIGDSLASSFLYEVPNNLTGSGGDRIIGSYHGRTERTSDYDAQMFLCAKYFNAMILFENDRGDVFSNAKTYNMIDMLVDEPEFMYNKTLQGGGKGRKKGISIASNFRRKLTGAIYLKNWLLTERSTTTLGKKILNLHLVYDIGFLKELLKYDGKRNTDRCSAAIVGMFDTREQLFKGLFENSTGQNSILDDEYFTGGLYN